MSVLQENVIIVSRKNNKIVVKTKVNINFIL